MNRPNPSVSMDLTVRRVLPVQVSAKLNIGILCDALYLCISYAVTGGQKTERTSFLDRAGMGAKKQSRVPAC